MERQHRPFHRQYLAFYSSWFGGIVLDPLLMMLPADDHMCHRGDAVFEAFKCVAGAVYNLGAHLDRLLNSAAMIGLPCPQPRPALEHIVLETIRASRTTNCGVRVYLARGPGSFSARPDECPESQLYVVVTRPAVPIMERFPDGVAVTLSTVPVKPAPFAAIKSCNYLPNVLMEAEAEQRGAQFSVAFDERGFLAEGATENVGIVTTDGRLLFPNIGRILPGTTLLRIIELAHRMVAQGALKTVAQTDISRASFGAACEVLVCGTTPDVTAVVSVDGRSVGAGMPGAVFRELSRRLQDDMLNNAALRTPV